MRLAVRALRAPLLVLLWGSQPAWAAERIAVLILGGAPTDAALADDLTEVVISRIGERGNTELAGTIEFRQRLGNSTHKKDQACVEDIACLGEVAVFLGVRRAITGTVRARAADFLVNMRLTNVETGQVESRFFRLVPGAIPQLVRAVQEGTDELFTVRPAPGRVRVEGEIPSAHVLVDQVFLGYAPVLSGPLLAGTHLVRVEADGRFPWQSQVVVRPDDELLIRLNESDLARRRRWPTVAASSALVAAVLSLSGAAIFGLMSQVEPSGSTAMQAQTDLFVQQNMATTANVMFASAGVLGATAVGILFGYRRDIAGE